MRLPRLRGIGNEKDVDERLEDVVRFVQIVEVVVQIVEIIVQVIVEIVVVLKIIIEIVVEIVVEFVVVEIVVKVVAEVVFEIVVLEPYWMEYIPHCNTLDYGSEAAQNSM